MLSTSAESTHLIRLSLGAIARKQTYGDAVTTLSIEEAQSSLSVAREEKRTSLSRSMFDAADSLVPDTGNVLPGRGAYRATSEGKAIAGSYLDNFNALVRRFKNDPNMMRPASQPRARALVGDSVRSDLAFVEGTVLYPKIDNAKLLASARDTAKVLALLKKSEQLVFLGFEQDGFVKVQSPSAEGWVRKVLVSKR
jgi:hypothetical protein